MIGNICNAGDYRTWPTHGLIFLWECGHLLAMHWRYIIGATIMLCYYFSIVLVGLWVVCKSHGHCECYLCSILLQCLRVACCGLRCSILLPFLHACGFILCKSLLVSLHLVCGLSILHFAPSVACHCYAKQRLYLLLECACHHRRVWKKCVHTLLLVTVSPQNCSTFLWQVIY